MYLVNEFVTSLFKVDGLETRHGIPNSARIIKSFLLSTASNIDDTADSTRQDSFEASLTLVLDYIQLIGGDAEERLANFVKAADPDLSRIVCHSSRKM